MRWWAAKLNAPFMGLKHKRRAPFLPAVARVQLRGADNLSQRHSEGDKALWRSFNRCTVHDITSIRLVSGCVISGSGGEFTQHRTHLFDQPCRRGSRVKLQDPRLKRELRAWSKNSEMDENVNKMPQALFLLLLLTTQESNPRLGMNFDVGQFDDLNFSCYRTDFGTISTLSQRNFVPDLPWRRDTLIAMPKSRHHLSRGGTKMGNGKDGWEGSSSLNSDLASASSCIRIFLWLGILIDLFNAIQQSIMQQTSSIIRLYSPMPNI